VTLTPELKQNINSNPNSGLNVDEDKGVLIAKVIQNSPAAKAGLRAGDVIQKVNGQAVKGADDIQKLVENVQVGSNLKLELRRSQKNVEVMVQPGAFPTTRKQ